MGKREYMIRSGVTNDSLGYWVEQGWTIHTAQLDGGKRQVDGGAMVPTWAIVLERTVEESKAPLELPKGWRATQNGVTNEHCAFRVYGQELVEVVMVVAGSKQGLRLRYNTPVEVDALRYLLANYMDGAE